MKSIVYILIILIFSKCSNSKSKKEIFSSDFNWTITIPEGFTSLSENEIKRLQDKGLNALEKTYDTTITNCTKNIFFLKSDDLNYFESNYQLYDTIVDGNYLEMCQAINAAAYETYVTQMPGIKVDTSSSFEQIDGLKFRVMKISATYPNKLVLTILSYSRLFDNKDFSVNIMYTDKEKGKLMIDSWKNSKFGSKKISSAISG